jgi:hypothetical protein
LHLLLTLDTKLNSKCIKYLNVTAKTVKLLWEKAFKHWIWKWSFGYVTKTWQRKIGKLEYIKIKTFWVSKGTIQQRDGENREWEKLFTNCISQKGLILQINESVQFKIINQTIC